MSELELLYLVLVALYLWECACWIRSGSVGLVKSFTCWRVRKPGDLVGNFNGGFIFAPPLPPLGTVLISSPFPLPLSPLGLVPQKASGKSHGSSEELASFIPWEDLGEIHTKGKRVLSRRTLLARTNSLPRAHELANELRGLQKLPAAQREAAIRRLIANHFDRKKLHARWEQFHKRRPFLRALAGSLFAFLFGLAPVAIWRFGLTQTWPVLLAVLLSLTSGIAFAFGRLHKLLYPELSDDRFTHFLLNLLSPASSIRCQEVLTRPLLEGFHPVTLVCALGHPRDATTAARFALRSLAFAQGKGMHSSQTRPSECQEFFFSALRQAMEKLLRQNRMSPDDLLRPPRPMDSECRSYCPGCEAQFIQVGGKCPDCGRADLVSLGKSP